MLKKENLYFAGTLIFSLFISCSNGGKEKATESEEETTQIESNALESDSINQLTRFRYDNVIGNIPLPTEIMEDIYRYGYTYIDDLTNPPSNVKNYSTTNSKAINLGIYGADLSYLVAYEQYNKALKYIQATKILSDDLSIPFAFDQSVIERIEMNEGNKDSLTNIIYGAYDKIDKTLRSDQRIGIAALVLIGGWVESLYSSTQMFTNHPENEENEILRKRIWEQHFQLANMLKLLNDFKDDPFFSDLISGLEDIQQYYKSLQDLAEINENEVNVLNEKITAVRDKLVNV